MPSHRAPRLVRPDLIDLLSGRRAVAGSDPQAALRAGAERPVRRTHAITWASSQGWAVCLGGRQGWDQFVSMGQGRCSGRGRLGAGWACSVTLLELRAIGREAVSGRCYVRCSLGLRRASPYRQVMGTDRSGAVIRVLSGRTRIGTAEAGRVAGRSRLRRDRAGLVMARRLRILRAGSASEPSERPVRALTGYQQRLPHRVNPAYLAPSFVHF